MKRTRGGKTDEKEKLMSASSSSLKPWLERYRHELDHYFLVVELSNVPGFLLAERVTDRPRHLIVSL